MFQAVRNTFMAATAALTLGLLAGGAQAAVIDLVDNQSYPFDTNNLYIYEERLDADTVNDNDRVFTFTANSSQLPLSIRSVNLTLKSVGGSISGFFMKLSNGVTPDVFVNIIPAAILDGNGNTVGFSLTGVIENAFSDPDGLTQTLTIGWDDISLSGRNAIQISVQVSAVPLPAGGLLLIGAIGGLAALRRRKALAA